MLTKCTLCQTSFRISAPELKAARGWVRCGFCHERFDALEHLSDDPEAGAPDPEFLPELTNATQETAVVELADVVNAPAQPEIDISADLELDITAEQAPEAEAPPQEDFNEADTEEIPLPMFDPDVDVRELRAREQAQAALDSDSEIDEALADFEIETHEPLADDGFDLSDEDITETKDIGPEDAVAEEEIDPAMLDTRPQYAFGESPPETLEPKIIEAPSYPFSEERPPVLEPKAKDKARWPWFVLCSVLALTLLMQVTRENADALKNKIPAVAGAVDSLCASVSCRTAVDLASKTENDKLKMTARDVREHPRYENTLLVNASIVNQADEDHRFPVLTLSLYNGTGEIIGRRSFEPGEYLDTSIDTESGMRPGVPIHVTLEIAGSLEEAVSFEFQF